MKALVKKTGKVVNVSRNTHSYSEISGEIYNENELCFDDFEIQKAEEWEHRRYEIAKEIIVRTVHDSFGLEEDVKEDADFAVRYADALIEELKKK